MMAFAPFTLWDYDAVLKIVILTRMALVFFQKRKLFFT
jgi:hypothetical protein